MAYRESVPESFRDRFWYGPFKNPLEVLGFALLFVVLAFVALSTLRQANRLDCERAAGQCSVTRVNLVGMKKGASFAIANVKNVEWNHGESLVVFKDGGNLRLPSLPEEEARGQHARLTRFLGGDGTELHESHESGWPAKLGTLALALVVGGVALWSFLQMLPMRVRVFERRIFVARERRSIDITRVRRIVVETLPEKPRPRRIALLSGGDDIDFLSSKFRGGWSSHEVVAARLGKLLGVPVDLDGHVDHER